jgi:hypothetical protein
MNKTNTHIHIHKYIVYTGPVTDNKKMQSENLTNARGYPFLPLLMSLITALLPTAVLQFQKNCNIIKPEATYITYCDALLYQ